MFLKIILKKLWQKNPTAYIFGSHGTSSHLLAVFAYLLQKAYIYLVQTI